MTEHQDHIKILITNTNQHIVCYLYQEDLEKDYYVVIDPMLVCYSERYEENSSTPKFEASFLRFCPLSVNNIYNIRKEWIVCIADPDKHVLDSYTNTINNPVLIPEYQ